MGSRARLICEIALATQTAPSQWWSEDSSTLATVLAILDQRARAIRKAQRNG